VGDFNLYRSPENRNRVGADINDMFLFNGTISHLGLSEISLQGKKFTWSNMQQPPLLEKLDSVFTDSRWTLSFLKTTCKALSMEVSDHTPLVITVSTSVPRSNIFRFENSWLLREDF
jgi:endonuclease/exonuclease/phosphatase family metal-dependent hydrolase